MINISFLNFWPNFNTKTTSINGLSSNDGEHFCVLYNILNQIGCDFQVTNPSIAHVIFYSCFGNLNIVKNYPNAISILIFHEPKILFNYSMKYILSIYDYHIGYPTDGEYLGKEDRVLLSPLWLWIYDFYNDQSDVYKYINNNICKSEWKLHDRSLLGCMISRSDHFGFRKRLFKLLCNAGIHLDCPSKVCNNQPSIESIGSTKDQYLSKYIFNFCPENNSQKNYVTEKIFHCCMNGCVPVYFGPRNFKDSIEGKIFNLNRIIIYDASNVEDVVNTCNVLSDMCINFDTKLLPLFEQPIFLPTATSTIKNQIKILRNFLKKIIDTIVI
jgi:hypothetical protein